MNLSKNDPEVETKRFIRVTKLGAQAAFDKQNKVVGPDALKPHLLSAVADNNFRLFQYTKDIKSLAQPIRQILSQESDMSNRIMEGEGISEDVIGPIGKETTFPFSILSTAHFSCQPVLQRFSLIPS